MKIKKILVNFFALGTLHADLALSEQLVGSFFWKDNLCYTVNSKAELAPVDFISAITDKICPNGGRLPYKAIANAYFNQLSGRSGDNTHLLNIEASIKQKKIVTRFFWKDNLCQRAAIDARTYEVASFKKATDGSTCKKLSDYSLVIQAYREYLEINSQNSQIFLQNVRREGPNGDSHNYLKDEYNGPKEMLSAWARFCENNSSVNQGAFTHQEIESYSIEGNVWYDKEREYATDFPYSVNLYNSIKYRCLNKKIPRLLIED